MTADTNGPPYYDGPCGRCYWGSTTGRCSCSARCVSSICLARVGVGGVEPGERLTTDEGTDPTLLWLLRRAGDEWGPMGVALTAVSLTDERALLARLDAATPAEDGAETAAMRASARSHANRPHPYCPSCVDNVIRLADALDRERRGRQAAWGHNEVLATQRDAARGLAAAFEAELARVRAAVNVGATPALIAEILDEATDA